jgi:outer membrane protein TolC
LRPKLIVSILAIAALPAVAGERVAPVLPDPQLGVSLEGDRTITLDQAIDIARTHDPNLSLRRSSSDLERAIAQESRGLFDNALEASLDAEWLRAELLPATSRQVFGQREIQYQFATIFQRVADDLQREIDGDPNFQTIPCSDVLQQGTEIILTAPDGTTVVIRCTPEDEPSSLGDIITLLANSDNTDPELAQALKDYESASTTAARASIQQIIDILNLNAQANREQLRRLGVAPTEEQRIGFTLLTAYRHTMRNGMSLAPRFGIQTIDESFVAKQDNPNYGGKGKIKFQSAAGLEMNIPLGRGGGIGVADALEKSAILNYKASLSAVRHAESSTVLRAGQAYWNLLAAQKRLEVAEETVGRTQQTLEIGRDLADGGEIPEVDLTQLLAQAAQAQRVLSQARVSVRQAQASLARVIGLNVDDPDDLPVATGELPDVIAPETLRAIEAESLFDEALVRRADLAEVSTRVDAAKTLTWAARKELRPKVDLSFFFAYQGQHNAYSYGEGLSDVMFGKWTGPSAGLTLSFELPHRNLTQIGQYRRTLALERQSEIQAKNLQRVTLARISSLRGSLIEAAEVIVRFENAERMYMSALDDVREKFEKGEGTALDEIYTQEQLASAQLTLVSARLTFANLLAQLRFETGTITEPEFGDTMADVLGTPPAVARRVNDPNENPADRLAAALADLSSLPESWP